MLQVGSGRDRTPLTVKLNGKAIDLGKPYHAASKNVRASVTAQNRIQAAWPAKNPPGERPKSGGAETLKLV